MEKLNDIKLSLNFNTREKKAKQTPTILYCVVRINEKVLKIPFGCKLLSSHWDNKKQNAKINELTNKEERNNNFDINKKINAIRTEYYNYYLSLCGYNSNIEIVEIENNIKNIINNITPKQMANKNAIPPKRTITATKLLKQAFEILFPEKVTKESTKKANKYYLATFFNYIEETKRGDTPKLLTQNGLNDYKEYLRQKGNSTGHINHCCGLIKRLINDVLCINSDFRKWKFEMVNYVAIKKAINNDESKKRALTDAEIKAIENCKELTEKEIEYRDVFLMQLNCGVRVSDLPKLFKGQYKIQEKDGICTYIIDTQKEGITAAFTTNDKIIEIQKKYENEFKFIDIDNEYFDINYNNNLRKIFKKAGLTSVEKYSEDKGGYKVKKTALLCDIITNHFARHTLITNKLREGFSCDDVSYMTGHSDDTMIKQIYSHLTDVDKANKVIEATKKINSEKKNHEESESDNLTALLLGKKDIENHIKEKETEIKEFQFQLKNLAKNLVYEGKTKISKHRDIGFKLIEMGKVINESMVNFPNEKERKQFLEDNGTLLDLYKIRLEKHPSLQNQIIREFIEYINDIENRDVNKDIDYIIKHLI